MTERWGSVQIACNANTLILRVNLGSLQVSVFMHVEVIRMGEVDTKNQKFESETRIISRWLEPELDRKQKLVNI